MIDLTIPFFVFVFLIAPAGLTWSIVGSSLGVASLGYTWHRSAIIAFVVGTLFAALTTSYWSISYEGTGILSKPLQFALSLVAHTLLPCLPTAIWRSNAYQKRAEQMAQSDAFK